MIMGDCAKDGVPSGSADKPCRFISSTVGGVKLVIPVWIFYMQLERVDTNDGTLTECQKARGSRTRRGDGNRCGCTIDRVHALDFFEVLATLDCIRVSKKTVKGHGWELTCLDNVKVELIPEGQCCPFGAWEVGNGTKVQAPYDAISNVRYAQTGSDDAEIDEFYHC